MEIQTQLIISLHKIDKRLNIIEEQKGDLPLQIKELEDKLHNIKQIILDSKNFITDFEKEKNSYNVNIKEYKAKLEKYNEQIFKVKNNVEYDALLVEIDYIKNQNQEIVDKIKDIDQNISDNQNIKTDSDDKIKTIEENLIHSQEELKVASESSKKEEKELKTEKNKIIGQINNNKFLLKYKDSNSRSIIESISRGSCNNCYCALPAQLEFDIKKREELISCPDCGIYLYFDENEED